jgi:hypothetical protein
MKFKGTSYRKLPSFLREKGVEPLLHFWNQFLIQRKIKPLERFTWDMNWNGTFNAPEPCYHFYFVNIGDGIVGEMSGGMSPLHDTFYLFDIKVRERHGGKHYELSMLVNIAQRYGVPITAMHQIDSNFWNKMQRFASEELQLNSRISANELDTEKQKWHHLFEKIIRQQKHAKSTAGGNWINLSPHI